MRLYGNVCCQGSLELAELELKSELRSQLKLERCALRFMHCKDPERQAKWHLQLSLWNLCSSATMSRRRSDLSALTLEGLASRAPACRACEGNIVSDWSRLCAMGLSRISLELVQVNERMQDDRVEGHGGA